MKPYEVDEELGRKMGFGVLKHSCRFSQETHYFLDLIKPIF